MANLNITVTDQYDALLTTTLRKYQPRLQDQIFRGLPLLNWLNNKGRKKTQDGGYEIIVPLLYGENDNMAFYQMYDTVPTNAVEGITAARYQWKNFATSILISRDEERKNSGQTRLINLLESKIMQAEKSMQWYINDQLHGLFGSFGKTFAQNIDDTAFDAFGGTAYNNAQTGTDAGFNSLDHFVRMFWGMADPSSTSDITHKVGGITVKTKFSTAATGEFNLTSGVIDQVNHTNGWWMNYAMPGLLKWQRGGKLGARTSQVEDAWSAQITGNANQNLISGMRVLYNRISDGAEHPDIGLTSQEVYEAYEGALMPLERFTDTKLGDAGFQNLRFRGMTLMFDHGITVALPTDVTSNTTLPVPLYMLNSDYLQWYVDSASDFSTTEFKKNTNQLARVAQILLMAQLTCSNRSKQGVMSCVGGSSNIWWA